jgi:hypothetical protein
VLAQGVAALWVWDENEDEHDRGWGGGGGGGGTPTFSMSSLVMSRGRFATNTDLADAFRVSSWYTGSMRECAVVVCTAGWGWDSE